MIDGKRIVVIAGSSGIGLEVARLAARRGARVTITGRDESRLAQAANDITGIETAAFDAGDEAALTRFFAGIDVVDHLVSCFGDTAWGGFLDLDEIRAREVFERKFWSQLRIVRAARGKMAQDGSIVLTAGTAFDRGVLPYGAAYSLLGNTALEVLVHGLAAEIRPIRVNLIEPTITDTPLFAGMPEEARRALFDDFVPRLPIGRIPRADEVARSYIHLMESGLVNGDRIRPDGGPMISVI